jgi:membrane glycosyltransferase
VGLIGVLLFVPALLTGGMLRVLLLLAAFIVLCYGFVAVSCAQTVLLIDGAGPAASLSRSWRLTAGSFWRLSMIYTVALIILLVLYVVTAAIAGFVAGVLGRGDFAVATASAEVVGVALGALATPFYSALALAVLGDLKVRKEGDDLERRISSATA